MKREILLIPKLPSPREDDLSQGILETIDLESYRNDMFGNIKWNDADNVYRQILENAQNGLLVVMLEDRF